MATHKVTCPVQRFTGESAGVLFRNSVALLDVANPADKAALAYFLRRDYRVEAIDGPAADSEDEPDAGPERPKDYASKAEWVAYAIARGADPDDAENSTKADLVERYGSNEDEEGTDQ